MTHNLNLQGLARIEDAKIETDGKKAQYYVAHVHKKGRAAREVIRLELVICNRPIRYRVIVLVRTRVNFRQRKVEP